MTIGIVRVKIEKFSQSNQSENKTYTHCIR